MQNPSPSLEEGSWPVRRRSVLDWLIIETRNQRFIDNILVEMCERLVAAGVPVARATLHFRINHPQWLGARILWRRGLTEAEIDLYDYGTRNTAVYLKSPLYLIHEGATEVRTNLEVLTEEDAQNSLYVDLQAEGLTEYIAWPLEHTLGKRHVVTFTTDRKGGFEDEHIAFLQDLLPALALVSEIRLKNRFVRTLLETYVGPHASEQILAGATTRGSGVTVSAAILICDLRNFTKLSDLWPRDDVIDLLNAYFDAMSEPIERHGGEILKFMGDGLLAIFPLSKPEAAENLLQAIREAEAAIALLNKDNLAKGREPLGYGIGVHVGDVMYGNIGSRRRLDFTVIGPAVNIASRLESLTKETKRPVLLSRAFVELAGCASSMEHLGPYPVRGIGEPIDVYAFSGDGPAPTLRVVAG
ncbi:MULTISPECIES: adenylate/guanylate cyclase domain-containing protein [unclassified Ensifer]|uniref:adenylate/guanylate cyclase domain-containing protein n=1 Tax=unclassified Ensifer TaxID=2633371 RepID=UPI0008134B64|nr:MULTISPECIES: adenylate/guanylate cyclase domain-containing protein [unclassified Ensifer]OCP00496.1 adenylate cyclase [Ensifer sp. LC14]OCP05866.1 adenylate cyclase [Ensifer sp. LC11]OCP06615.1 adenylate cyclase [Ensifer sp. LC13]OCP31145.1 adenylate cyclase [Ensifer sp. LC499]